MAKKLIMPKANVPTNSLVGAVLSDGTTVTGLLNDTEYVAFSLSEASEEFSPVSQYTNAQARQWATKLSTPLSDNVAAAYDHLFDEIGDIITAKFDSFGIMATETREAAIKNLVFSAPDLEFRNAEVVEWTPSKGFSQIDFGETTKIDTIISTEGTGYTQAKATVSMPTGANPVQATFTAICSDGKVVGWTPDNGGGSGYLYNYSSGNPTVTFTGDGTGLTGSVQIYMGRIYSRPNPATDWTITKFKLNDCSMAIGSVEYAGSRGATASCARVSHYAAGGASSRVSFGGLGNWMGAVLTGTAELGVYSPANIGHYCLNRKNDTANIERYGNGVKLSSPAQAIGPYIYPEPVTLMSRKRDDVWKNLSKHSWYWYGAALTENEMLRMYYALNRFLAGLGVEAAAVVPFSTSMTVS